MGKALIRNGNFFCPNCGVEESFNLPIEVDEFVKNGNAFDKAHENCEKTFTEPKADKSNSVKHRALWWIANGEIGASSRPCGIVLWETKVSP